MNKVGCHLWKLFMQGLWKVFYNLRVAWTFVVLWSKMCKTYTIL